MQLRLIRFDLVISLLVSLTHVEALEGLSRVVALTPNPVSMPFQQVSSSRVNDERVFESPEVEGFVARINPENEETELRRDTRKGFGRKTNSKIIISSPSHSSTLLAEKLAQNALRSKEIQDMIKDLTSLKGDRNEHREMSKEPKEVFHSTAASHSTGHTPKPAVKNKSHSKHKVQGDRKHKKHRKRDRKHHHPKRRLKRHDLKKESSKMARKRKSGKSVNRGTRRGLKRKYSSEKSVTCRRKKSEQIMKVEKNDGDQNIVDKIPNIESTRRKYRRVPTSGKEEGQRGFLRKRSHMIAKLMQTTTRDPTKKKPGDQGVEYSEYYSDNDNILLPEIKGQSKMDEMTKNLVGGQIRSVRQAVDGNLLDQNYYDSADEELLREDGERLKRNDQKSVKVIQEPINSMEYVDNTNVPLQVNGVVDDEKNFQYLPNFNYIPDQGSQMSNPLAEVVRLGQPPSNQLPSNFQAIFNDNPPIIESMPNKAPSNLFPSLATSLNDNSLMNNVQTVASVQPEILGNVVLSQLPQPHLTAGNFPYYAISEMPSAQSTGSVISPAAFSMSTSSEKTVKNLGDIDVNIPESEKLWKGFTATSVVTSFSPSGFNSIPFYDTYRGNNRISGLGIRGRETSVVPASSKAPLAIYEMSSSPVVVNSVSLDSPELFPRLRDIRPEAGVPEATYVNYNDSAENIWGPDQIEPIASRETAPQDLAVKKGKRKGFDSTKTDVQASTTASEINEVNKHDASKAAKGFDYNLLPITSSQASLTPRSNTPELANATRIGNETKAVASEILNEIIDELEEMRLENPKDEQREGLPCRLTGSWVTARAGVRIDMKVTNHSVQVSLDHLTPPIITEGLLNVTWNVTGFAPFKRGGPFTLMATNNHTKTLAVFVGACKICQGIDTIEGSWTVSREPRDCRDFQMSTNIFNEIFRRTRLYSAIKDKHLKRDAQTLSTMVTTSANTSTSEITNILHEVSENLGKSHNQTLAFISKE